MIFFAAVPFLRKGNPCKMRSLLIFWRSFPTSVKGLFLPSKGSLNGERGLFGFLGTSILLLQYFQIFSNQVLAKLIGFLIVMRHMVYVIQASIGCRGCRWGCSHRTRIGGHGCFQHYRSNQSLSIFKAFNDYFEDGRNPYTARTAKNYDTYICVVSPTTSTCRGRRTSTGAAVVVCEGSAVRSTPTAHTRCDLVRWNQTAVA